MRIQCPHCGERSVEEFVAMGPADLRRPAPDASLEDFIDYAYARENPRGAHRELYYHAFGCRAWLIVGRDTFTHDVRPATAVTIGQSGDASA